jgi:hypothetical protein
LAVASVAEDRREGSSERTLSSSPSKGTITQCHDTRRNDYLSVIQTRPPRGVAKPAQ